MNKNMKIYLLCIVYCFSLCQLLAQGDKYSTKNAKAIRMYEEADVCFKQVYSRLPQSFYLFRVLFRGI